SVIHFNGLWISSLIRIHYMASSSNCSIAPVAEFLLICFPNYQTWQHWLRYCAENIIKNCICTNLSVSKLSCDDITLNRFYQFVAGWTLLGSDLILI
ncbi:hypothetical protein HPG69_005810, partial [Diceros bicornis minor]